MTMITRRTLNTRLAVTGAIGAFPASALAARVLPDIVLEAVRWSDDGGATWHTGMVEHGASLLFEATVSNQGERALQPGKMLHVEFAIDGSPVATATKQKGWFLVGETTVLRTESFWSAAGNADSTLRAVADPNRTFDEISRANNSLTVPFPVEVPEQAVVANDDTASTEIDTPVVIDVLANDVAPDGQELFVGSVQSPTDQGGTAAITADGKFVEFVPASGFDGEDSFTYEAIAA